MRRSLLAAAAVLFSMGLVEPAAAQKAKDTLRFPVRNSEPTLDPYLNPGLFDNVWEPSVYDSLLGFDPVKGAFVPHLAKSWSQPTPTTYEFVLRDDVKWHDGQAFDADDVVYMINYLIDPKVNLRFKANWEWIKSVEKLGPHKLRITSKEPVPFGLMWMASGTWLYPEHKHAPLADKMEFGASPVGTGPYRIVKFDKNAGLVAEKYEGYVPSATKPAASIGRVVAEPIPDVGTLVAALLTGKADLALNLPADQAVGLAKDGRFEVSLSPRGIEYTFIGFPTRGAERVKALGDVRVRKAIAMAIDREALIDAQFGELAAGIEPEEALCSKAQLGCGYAKLVPDYDPEGAKKLLAEAGYADGFDVTINTFPNRIVEATAVSGMLRAVGIRASVNPHQIPQRVKFIAEGRTEIGYYGWSGGSIFEVTPQIARHFLRNEYEDPTLVKMAEATNTIMDDAKRRKAVAEVFDYATEHAYAFPMLPSRATFTHTKEVKLNDVGIRATLVNPHDFSWK